MTDRASRPPPPASDSSESNAAGAPPASPLPATSAAEPLWVQAPGLAAELPRATPPSGPEAAPEPDRKNDRPDSRTDTGHQTRHHGSFAALALGALGVVYGDIGTSPLYALRECFHASTHIEPTPADILGLLSLFFWSLTIIITIKYVTFVTKADNEGEGGTLALLALLLPKRPVTGLLGVALLGMLGASLLYGEGILTPAISVTSAVEGIEGIRGLEHVGLDRFVVPVAVVILVILFAVQRGGTAKMGLAFGPVMLLWFCALAAMGLYWIVRRPEVLAALSPHHAVAFFLRNGMTGYWVLGSVVLCFTGGEALYADMGHFGRQPIAWAWRGFVWPALAINYFGQGALLLEHPEQHEDAFYAMVGEGWIRVPLVILATLATVVASQALISGAFSLTRAAIQLGFLPRLEIRHTSSEAEGQIYLPEVNWLLMVACITLVVTLQSSSNMAAAYGISVTGTMLITSTLFFLLARRWWGTGRALLLCVPFWLVDVSFFAANLPKLVHGGWIPLVIAVAMLAVMTTWKLGRERVGRFLRDRSKPLPEFLDEVDQKEPVRVRGTAVFMTSTGWGTPPVLLHHFKHNQVLHEQVVLLSIVAEDVPTVPRSRRVKVERLREGFFRVTASYGFMQSAKVTDILRACEHAGLHTRPDQTSFYLGREKLVITTNSGLSRWRKVLFSFLSRNSRSATDFFRLPPDRVVEMGMQLEI